MESMTDLDLVIVGAPRSGTNMLRDVLCSLPGFATWPCDEINYIWRHGNARWPTDIIPPQRADETVRSYIRRAFRRQREASGCEVLVEKTCANSLRVPFVDRVLPKARYLFIHRDSVDAVASAKLRWKAPFELRYTLAKARFVPVTDIPFYGLRFLRNRLHRLVSREERVAFWGPRLENMDELLREHSLIEVCAMQWRECVARAADAFGTMDAGRYHSLRYEDFVASPAEHLEAILTFLGREADAVQIEAAVADVARGSVGKGRRKLSDEESRAVERISGPALAALRRLEGGAASKPAPARSPRS